MGPEESKTVRQGVRSQIKLLEIVSEIDRAIHLVAILVYYITADGRIFVPSHGE